MRLQENECRWTEKDAAGARFYSETKDSQREPDAENGLSLGPGRKVDNKKDVPQEAFLNYWDS